MTTKGHVRFIVTLKTLSLIYLTLKLLVRLLIGEHRCCVFWNKLFGNITFIIRLPDGNRLLFRSLRHDEASPIQFIYNHHVYDFAKPNGIVIDAGAHIGIYTLKAACAVGQNGRVIAIEPHPENYRLLVRNILLNEYNHVVPIRLALADENGPVKLFLSPKGSLDHSIVFQRGNNWITVQAKKLDDVLKNLGVRKVDFLKLDVEGAELMVLRGAEKTLNTAKTMRIVMEVHNPAENLHDLKSYLTKKKFYVEIKQIRDECFLYAAKIT